MKGRPGRSPPLVNQGPIQSGKVLADSGRPRRAAGRLGGGEKRCAKPGERTGKAGRQMRPRVARAADEGRTAEQRNSR